jgi:hypothetical protein
MAELTYNQATLLRIRTAIKNALESETQSSTVSSGGGSESYSRLSLSTLREMEKEYERKVIAEGAPQTLVPPDFGGTD